MTSEDFKAIENATIIERPVELSKKTKTNRIYNSNFIRCDLLLSPRGVPSSRFGSRFHINRNVFDQCVIHADGRIHQFNVAESNIFRHCKFIGGPLTESVFGSGIFSDSEDVELLEMCDFTECDLRGARFFRTPIEKLKLPGWPHIAVVARDGASLYASPSNLNPTFSKILDEVEAFEWSDSKTGRLLAFATMIVGEKNGSASVAVYHAEDIAGQDNSLMELLKADLDRFAHPAFRY